MTAEPSVVGCHESRPRFAVAMSTYNGQAYLREQIDSILAQEGVDVCLYVRDDGSNDGTLAILDEYAEAYDNVHVTRGENLGVGNSFMTCLYAVPDEFDYYALADQDDIWLPRKLVEAALTLEKRDTALYFSNQTCVDSEGGVIGLRHDIVPAHDVIDVLCHNQASGCTMVFTAEFKRLVCEEVRRPSEALLRNRIQDVWLAMVGAVTCSITYDERSFILYRQHDHNVVGAAAPTFAQRVRQRAKKLGDASIRNGRSRLAQEIVSRYPSYARRYPVLMDASRVSGWHNKRKLICDWKAFSSYQSPPTFALYVIIGLF